MLRNLSKLTQKQKNIARKRLYKHFGKKCMLCKRPESQFKKRLCVDHSHSLGIVRGLLCIYCNRYRVGRLNFEWASKITHYLKCEVTGGR